MYFHSFYEIQDILLKKIENKRKNDRKRQDKANYFAINFL